MKLRVNGDGLTMFINGMVGFLSSGAFIDWAIDQANGRSDDGPGIMTARDLRLSIYAAPEWR